MCFIQFDQNKKKEKINENVTAILSILSLRIRWDEMELKTTRVIRKSMRIQRAVK